MGFFDRIRKLGVAQNIDTQVQDDSAIQEADDLMEKGALFEQQEQFDQAIVCYDGAIRLNPRLARAHFNLGNIFLDKGQAELALNAYANVLLYKPESAATHFNIGNAHLSRGETESAIVSYRRAVALKTDFFKAYVSLGSALDGSGKFAEAAEQFQLALAHHPNDADTLKKLGDSQAKLGNFVNALVSYANALKNNPNSIDTLMNLGAVQSRLGQAIAAAESYSNVLNIDPSCAEAHVRIGNLYQECGQLDRAIASYQHGLAIDSGDVAAHFNLGIALEEQGCFESAQESYICALRINPEHAEAHNNLGSVYRKQGQVEAALLSFRRAIDVNPDCAEAHFNLGNTLQSLAKYDEAATCIERALALKPDFAEAHVTLGSIWQNFEEYRNAEEEYRRAIEINPSLAAAYSNLGTILGLTRRFDEAMACYHQALEVEPDNVDALVNLGNVLKDMGRNVEALASLRQALTLDETCLQAHHNLLFVQNYLPEQSPEQMFADAKEFGRIAARRAKPCTSWPNTPESERKLRIGLVSGDLCSHPVGYFLVSVLQALSSLASNRIEIYAYPNRICNDVTSDVLKRHCAAWHSVLGMSDALLSKRIRDDRIDILLDLSGHTANNRLPAFAWKPAPVQATWLGYFATTGLDAIDYFIADPWTLLPSEEQFFSEKVWRLPDSRLCFTPPSEKVDVGPLPAMKNGFVTFGCFNNLSKLNEAVVDTWVSILKSVSQSKLFLKSQLVAESASRQRLIELFTSRGIDASRLILADYGPRAEYFEAYNQVDITLDPFPYPGGTTTVEALWMGVPVLTMGSTRFLSRQGVGLLSNAGLHEWVASDTEDYIGRATVFAGDLSYLAKLRASLREQILGSPIYDAERFARNFESALRGMWKTWCAQCVEFSNSSEKCDG